MKCEMCKTNNIESHENWTIQFSTGNEFEWETIWICKKCVDAFKRFLVSGKPQKRGGGKVCRICREKSEEERKHYIRLRNHYHDYEWETFYTCETCFMSYMRITLIGRHKWKGLSVVGWNA